MNQSNSRNIVLIATAGMFVIGLGKAYVVDGKSPSFRFYLSIAVIGTGLSVTADLSPRLAGPLALLIFMVVAFDEGGPLLDALNHGKVGVGANPNAGPGGVNALPLLPITRRKPPGGGKPKFRVLSPKSVPALGPVGVPGLVPGYVKPKPVPNAKAAPVNPRPYTPPWKVIIDGVPPGVPSPGINLPGGIRIPLPRIPIPEIP